MIQNLNNTPKGKPANIKYCLFLLLCTIAFFPLSLKAQQLDYTYLLYTNDWPHVVSSGKLGVEKGGVAVWHFIHQQADYTIASTNDLTLAPTRLMQIRHSGNNFLL